MVDAMSLVKSIWQERGRGELVVEESVIMMRQLSLGGGKKV